MAGGCMSEANELMKQAASNILDFAERAKQSRAISAGLVVGAEFPQGKDLLMEVGDRVSHLTGKVGTILAMPMKGPLAGRVIVHWDSTRADMAEHVRIDDLTMTSEVRVISPS